MPNLKAVSFDCAGTLLDVRWSPGPFAVACAREIGLDLDDQVAQEIYERLLRSRWPDYVAANQTGSVESCLEWWRNLTRTWLKQIESTEELTDDLMLASERLLYDPCGPYFRPFEDAVRALDAVARIGLPIVVISNWDYSLHRILQVQGLTPYFAHVFASLQEGVEKPDPRLFHIALDALGLEAAEVLHVGDDPADDYSGARAAGLHALLIDRGAARSEGFMIRSLEEVVDFI